jgi:RHS repeat-associated protein
MTPGSGSSMSYGYDADGNLTTTPTGATATYDHESELASTAQGGTTTSYTYDADGQRLAATRNSAAIATGTWNGANELTAYANTTADMSSADYDGDGLRTSSTTIPAAGGSAATENFTWDPANSSLLMDSANAYIYGTGEAPAEQVNLSTGKISYLAADALGSVRGVVSSAGSLTASTSYDAWGNPQTTGGLTSYTPFGYAGGYTDPTGLIYLINRYYDPATGQFQSADPEADQTGTPYSYTGDNPVNDTDSTGLYPAGWIVALTTAFPPWRREEQFEAWAGTFMGVPSISTRQYRIDTDFPQVEYRIVDILVAKHWLNELKIGKQSADKGNKQQAGKDVNLINTHGHGFCHPQGGLACEPIPSINGANWWFGAKDGQKCQDNNTLACPSAKMIDLLLDGPDNGNPPYVNIILVYSVKGRKQRERDREYSKNKRIIRRMLSSNSCPTKLGKYAPTWPIQFNCDD